MVSSIQNLTIFNCLLVQNNNGIAVSSLSGNVNIENTTISNSTYNALFVCPDEYKTIDIRKSRFIRNEGTAIRVYGDYAKLSLFATNTFFGWNKGTTVYSEIRYSIYQYVAITSFKNCTFLKNQGPVINIKQSSIRDRWQFVENVFMSNTQPSVIMTTQYTHSNYLPAINITKNKFLFNLCQEKGVIDVIGGTKELIIAGNIFEGNSGRSVYLEETSRSSITAQNNVFKDNNCSEKGVVEVRAMDKEIKIVGNVFESNKGQFMVLLNSVYYIGRQMVKNHLNFTTNSFVNNTAVATKSFACEFDISGLMEHKTITIHHNIFDSYKFAKELCVNIFASSSTSVLDVSFNFWGYDDEAQIRKRIFDAESNYEHAFAVFVPFISSSGRVVYSSSKTGSFEAQGSLGGRLSDTVQLNKTDSPYKVVSDLTILPHASLIIDPGVEVQFDPGVGMLILGSLFVYGNLTHPVTFSLKKHQGKTSMLVRLAGGRFPWQGRVEVMYHGNWTPLCSNGTLPVDMNSAKVICEQLGYQAPLNINQNSYETFQDACKFSVRFRCRGNETAISECKLTSQNHHWNSSRQVFLNCAGGKPWGNLRFRRELRTPYTPTTSKLQHLNIVHCGNLHGKEVAAIEMLQHVSEVNSVLVLNCTAGGSKVWFQEKEVYLKNSSFINTGGYGTEIGITKKNVTLDKVSLISNRHGLSFMEPKGHWMDGLSYGQIMLCAWESVVNLADGDVFLYSRPPLMNYFNPYINCKKVVQTGKYGGFAIKLLVMKNVEYIIVHDPHGNEILKYSSRHLPPLSRRRLIPWSTITIYFKGWFSTSEVLLHLQRVEDKGKYMLLILFSAL